MADRSKMRKWKLEEENQVCEKHWTEKYCLLRIQVALYALYVRKA
jgi:hypothetical protein